MRHVELQPMMAWAEDRALLRSGHRPKVGPSADPGAKIGDGAARGRSTPFTPISEIGTNAKNLCGHRPQFIGSMPPFTR